MEARNVRILALFDLRTMIRQRETILWAFLMPVLFMFLIGKMTEARGGGGEPVVAVLDRDGGALSGALLARLDSLGYEIRRVDADSTLEGYRRQLRLPAGFTRGALAGEEQEVSWTRKGEASEGSMLDKVQMQRALLQVLGDLVTLQAEGDSVNAASLAEVRTRPPAILVETTAAGFTPVAPDGFQQSVPGILVMFVLLVLLTTGGVSLVIERDEGLLRRLASAPVSRSEIVLAKLLSRVGMGLVQSAFAILVGTLLFHVDWGGRLPEIAVLLGVYGVSISTLSLLFGNLARTQGQTIGFGVLAANLFGALGGCWWPIEVVPSVMQKVAWFLPTGWAMYGMHRLMNFGDGLGAVLPSLGLMAGSALVFFYLAQRTFRFE